MHSTEFIILIANSVGESATMFKQSQTHSHPKEDGGDGRPGCVRTSRKCGQIQLSSWGGINAGHSVSNYPGSLHAAPEEDRRGTLESRSKHDPTRQYAKLESEQVEDSGIVFVATGGEDRHLRIVKQLGAIDTAFDVMGFEEIIDGERSSSTNWRAKSAELMGVGGWIGNVEEHRGRPDRL